MVGAKGFGLANHGRVIGFSLCERLETPICIDVIDDNRPTRPQRCPGSIDLKANVVFTVKTVMNEKVDLAKSGKNAGKPPFA
jgi:hypothetical protein